MRRIIVGVKTISSWLLQGCKIKIPKITYLCEGKKYELMIDMTNPQERSGGTIVYPVIFKEKK